MKYSTFLILLTAICTLTFAQPADDATLLNNLKGHVNFLADDRLEGRRTGSNGEKIAARYIADQFKNAGLTPMSGDYLQPFEVNEGLIAGPENSLSIHNKKIPAEAWFPMAWTLSAKVKTNTSKVSLVDVGTMIQTNANNPHYDLEQSLRDEIAKLSASVVVLYNASSKPDNLKFNRNDKGPKSPVPVIYINDTAFVSMFRQKGKMKLRTDIRESKRKGLNVVGFINNNAEHTIVLGAHYDHLGYGEDRNSLYAGPEKMIHNGADDNASGTAALIELASMLKQSGPKQNNYLLVAFSGEELGLFGSKYFTENSPVPLTSLNYMINMDMVGRLDNSKGLTVGGFGTSPAWNGSIKSDVIKINFDSSGSGPSDHTSFYRKDIPVLFFFTGSHQDYHKPSDDAHLVNYEGQKDIVKLIFSVIEKTSKGGKLAFLKTREPVMARTSFKVSLGIMPDYTFSGSGVKVDGVSEGRPAHKAGLKTGDVVTKLGSYRITDVQSYMEALSKFNKGETITVEVSRGGSNLSMPLTF